MKKIFNALLISGLSLHVPSFFDAAFSKDPLLQSVKTVDHIVPPNNPFFGKRLFLSNDVIWDVDPYEGTIKALDSRCFSPKWSSSGIVYRVPVDLTVNQLDTKRSDRRDASPLFGSHIEFTEILGRVYFHLSEQNQTDVVLRPALNPPSSDYTDQILAFDPQSQGKLLWKLKTNDFEHILSKSSKSVPYFAATPLEGRDNILIVVLTLDSRSFYLKIDARSGKLILD